MGIIGRSQLMLPIRKRKFCRRYFETDHAKNSAIDAGYSKNGAATKGYNMLQEPEVKEFMAKLYKTALKAYNVTEERIMKERCAIAFFNPRDIYYDDGTIKPLDEMPEHALRAISSIKTHKITGGAVTITSLKLHDKLDALSQLGKMYENSEPAQTAIQVNVNFLDKKDV
jgi:hypothetical protein